MIERDISSAFKLRESDRYTKDPKLCSNTPAAFPKESCKKAINWFEQNIDQARAGWYGVKGKRLNNLELSIRIESQESLFNLCDAIGRGLIDYQKKYPLLDSKEIATYALNTDDILMCKWEPNNYYERIHCEISPNSQNLALSRRVFSWMIYLNDIEHGGGTEFIYQGITTIPRAGDFIIFPSGPSHMHRGENAPYETKYIITGHYVYS
jgi:hypothetical protein